MVPGGATWRRRAAPIEIIDAVQLTHSSSGYGALAQLGERVLCKHEVVGSIPTGSTTLRPSGYAWRGQRVEHAGSSTHEPKGGAWCPA